jgi:hypothetical protein
MKRLFSKQSGLILLRWAAVAAALQLGTGALNQQATPEHPITRTGIVIGWFALVFFLAAVYHLIARGWRSPLGWTCASLAAVNYAAVSLHSDTLAPVIALSSLLAAAAVLFRLGAQPALMLAAASSLVLGLVAFFASILLAAPLNGICSRSAPWVCQLAGLLWGSVAAAVLCLAFWYSARRLDGPAQPAGR